MGNISNMTDRELLVECLVKLESMQRTIDSYNSLHNDVKNIDIRVAKIETEHKVRGGINGFVAGVIASLITLIVKYLIEK